MQPFTLNQAAKICHKSKSSLLEAINSGRLSANRNDKNQWQIDPSELFRVYPYKMESEQSTEQKTDNENHVEPLENHQEPPENHQRNTDFLAELLEKEKEERERERHEMKSTIEDLRQRLNQSEDERRSAQEKLSLLLEHKPLAPAEPKIEKRGENKLWQKIFRK
jgi:hypothetical protein